MDEIDKRLLELIQNEIPIDKRPFKILGKKLLITEEEVLQRINKLKVKGFIRRIGGIFDSRKLGYTSTLCAVKVPGYRVDEVAKYINKYDEITHNYVREDSYNIWFTIITCSEESLHSIIEKIKINTGLKDIINLPSNKLFKVKVILNLGSNENAY